MSIYSQPAFTPLTVASNVLHPHPPRPESALTREQTLSFDGSVQSIRGRSPPPPAIIQQQLQVQHVMEDALSHSSSKHSIPIPEDTEIGTSAAPLNELMKDIEVLVELIPVHRVSHFLSEYKCTLR
jgi:hypothetical protein